MDVRYIEGVVDMGFEMEHGDGVLHWGVNKGLGR
jgi:hypothetical protein